MTTYFYLGDAANLRDSRRGSSRPGRSRTIFTAICWACMLRAGGIQRLPGGRNNGRRAVEGNPADTWAIHAVAMCWKWKGGRKEGISWLQGFQAIGKQHLLCGPSMVAFWAVPHRARPPREVLDIYDKHVRGTPSAAFRSCGSLRFSGACNSPVGVGDR